MTSFGSGYASRSPRAQAGELGGAPTFRCRKTWVSGESHEKVGRRVSPDGTVQTADAHGSPGRL